MLWTSGPAFLIIAGALHLIGLTTPATGTSFDPAAAQAVLAGFFQISLINLLPLVLLVVLSVRQVPPFLAIFGCALFAGVLACSRSRRSSSRSSASPSRAGLVTGDRGDLCGAGDRLRIDDGQRDDRRALLARWHGVDADHHLAGPREP